MGKTSLVGQQPQRRRGWMVRGLPWVALLLALAVLAATCTLKEDVPPLERRAQEINRGIMCPVCPGESIDQSQNPLAKQMRAVVIEKLEQGWTEEQIRAFFVERYGPSVLMEPPREGFSLLAWALPPAAVAGAILVLYIALRMMRRKTPETGAPAPLVPLGDEERERYIRRVESLLEGQTRSDHHTKPHSSAGHDSQGSDQ